MDDYLPRNALPPADLAGARTVATVQPAAPAGSDTNARAGGHSGRNAGAFATGANFDSGSEEQLASAAEYARVHARINDILASLRDSGGPVRSASASEAAIVSLLPAPVVIVPLPPASRDMVEQAARVAKQVADQAAFARAAQAHVKPGTVDQVMATAT